MRPARLVGHNADIPILPCKLRMPKFKAEKIRRGKQREKDIFQRSISKEILYGKMLSILM